MIGVQISIVVFLKLVYLIFLKETVSVRIDFKFLSARKKVHLNLFFYISIPRYKNPILQLNDTTSCAA